MKLQTKRFGEIEIEENKIIEFKEGLPGFDHISRFSLLPNGKSDMFYWLQSVDDPEIAFALLDMARFMPGYSPIIDRSELDGMGEYDPEKFAFYNIAVIPESIKCATVNLKAPVVINEETKQGRQVICENEEYAVRHYMFT